MDPGHSAELVLVDDLAFTELQVRKKTRLCPPWETEAAGDLRGDLSITGVVLAHCGECQEPVARSKSTGQNDFQVALLFFEAGLQPPDEVSRVSIQDPKEYDCRLRHDDVPAAGRRGQ